MPTNGLVGWWPFTGNANDLSGNGNNGTVNGATLTTDRFGNTNAAYSFDGVNDFISIPDNNSLDFTTTYTISVWVQIPDYSTPQFPNGSGNTDAVRTILGKPRGAGWQTGYSINSVYQDLSNNCSHVNHNGTSQTFVVSNAPLPLNTWINIIAVKTPTNISLYRNGVLEQTTNTTLTLINSSEPLYIGKEFTNTAPVDWYRWFKGKADDIGIWNRALTQQEVTNLYNSSLPSSTCLPSYVPTSGLVGYWPFCGNASDESGNGNNGTVNGATLTADRFGNANSAYSFANNGSTPQNIQTPLVGPTGTSARSISLWFLQSQSNGPSADWVLGGYGQNSPGRTFIPLIGADKAGMDISNSQVFYSSNTLGSWRNLVLVYDPSFGNTISAIKVYLDGVLLSTVFSSFNLSTILNTGTGINFFIGSSVLNQQFIGKIDDVGFWNRALTQQEITDLYNGACTAQIQQNDTTICAGQSITLSADTSSSSGIQACASTNLPSNLQTGLVAYYPFCGNANDASGNGNNGTVTSATLSTDRTGAANTSYYFNGSARIANNNNALRQLIDGNNPFSVGLWFNRDASGNNGGGFGLSSNVFFSFDGNNVSPFKRVYARIGQPNDTTTDIAFGRYNANTMGSIGDVAIDYKTNGFISPGTWNYLLVSYDGTDVKVYINGVQLTTILSDGNWYTGSQRRATTMGGPDNFVTGFTLGDNNQNNAANFAGKLDDVTLYNRALTSSEVLQLYTLSNTQYLWSNGATTPTINVSPTQTTTYTLTVTENGVSCTDNVTVTVNPLPTPSISGTNSICSGASTTLTASGGNSYVWSTGATTASITVSPTQTTTYTVTATGSNGCTASTNQTVTVNPAPTPSISGTNSICSGASTTLTASGSTSYVWSTGATTASITVSPTQTTTYTVTATNGNGCTGNTTRTVTVNPLPTPSISGVNAICAGASTTLTASGGTSYVWSNGSTSSSITVSPTQTTTYTVTATNSNGCSASVSQAVTVNPAPTPSISGTNSICSGASTTLTASGGNSYVWSTGATTASITVSPTQTTTYSVTATGSNGCTANATITVTVNPAPTPSITGTNTICSGNSTTLTASGGTSYVWSTGATTASITVSPTQTTTYTVTATGINGCTGNTTRTVTVNPLPTPSISGVNTICAGNSTTLTASGGSSYAWSNGSTSSSITVSPTQTTTYTVTATNSNGCSASVSQVVTVNPSPTPSISGTNSICSGDSTTLTASGGNSYVWSTGATTASITVSPTQTTTYSVTATGSNGCTANATITVTVNPAPTPSITGTNTICSGNSTTLTASGGTSYVWSTGATTASITVSPTQTTTYTVTATGINGCTGNTTRTVTVNPLPTPSISGVNTICAGNSTTLTASGGTSYVWSTGATTASITVSPTQTTTYTVTATNGNGCTASVSQAVTVNPAPTPSISGTNSICSGASTTLTASGGNSYVWSTGATTASISVSPSQTTTYSVTATGSNGCTASTNQTVTVNPAPTPSISGTNSICSGASTTLTASGDTSYVWSTGATTASITVSPNQTTTYTVTVTNGNGCSASTSQTVTVSPSPSPSITGVNSICLGANTTLTASGGNSYVWSNGSTSSSITVAPNQTTTYTVTVFNGNGCSASASQTVTVSNSPSINIAGVTSICQGSTTTLTATGGVSYTWNTGATANAITVSPNQTTTYNVTVDNGSGCSSDSSVTVTVLPGPVLSISGTNTLCSGNSTTLTVSGGNNYSWSNGATSASITVSPTQTTTYTVTSNNGNGCTAITNITVTVNPTPVATITPSATVCSGSSVVLTATGGDSYLWSTGSTNSSITVSPTQTTNYNVAVSNLQGCTTNASTSINVVPALTPLDSIYGPTVVDTLQPYAYFVTLDFNADAYQWITNCGTITTGQGTNSINVIWDDTASCELIAIVSNAGCSDTISTIVNQNVTAIIEQGVRDNFFLYPNPAIENITISLNKPANNIAIEVYDMYGKLIMAEVNKSGKQFDLNTSTIASGAYCITLTLAGIQSRAMFIKN